MAGWGNFFGKIAEQFQGRIERLKNEKEKLIDERKILTSKEYSASSSRRVVVIDDRLHELDILIENAARD